MRALSPTAAAQFCVMLCNSCQQRLATCHTVNIVDGVTRTRDLCQACFDASSPAATEFASTLRDARCEYCGSQPCFGGTDFLALVTGVQKQRFMCFPCSMEHNRFVQQELERDASGVSPQEQLSLIRKLNEKADQHMKQWVSEMGAR